MRVLAGWAMVQAGSTARVTAMSTRPRKHIPTRIVRRLNRATRETTAIASHDSAGLRGPPVIAIPTPSGSCVTSQPPRAQYSGRRRRPRSR